MVKLAFYKGEGDWTDKLIRWWTGSKYSHVEMIIDGRWYSSSPRNGYVRSKIIIPKEDHWDFVDVEVTECAKYEMLTFFKKQLGKKYDWAGIFLSQVLPLEIQDPGRWFCSEICSAALKRVGKHLEKPAQWYSPGRLYESIMKEAR